MSSPPAPVVVRLPAGEYRWCGCGAHDSPPLCPRSDCVEAKTFTVRARRNPEVLWLCNCRHSRDLPFCDGSHNKLPRR